MSVTGVEWWDSALITLPEILTLVLCVLRRRPAVFIGVIGVHIWSSRSHAGMSIWKMADRSMGRSDEKFLERKEIYNRDTYPRTHR